MLRVDADWIKTVEANYPGIREQIRHFEEAILPICPYCNSDNTADVQCGIIGRTIHINGATTKFRLIPNGPKPGKYYCNACGKYFGNETEQAKPNPKKNLNTSDLLDMLDKNGGFTVSVKKAKRRKKQKS